jgi:hypothetical protein
VSDGDPVMNQRPHCTGNRNERSISTTHAIASNSAAIMKGTTGRPPESAKRFAVVFVEQATASAGARWAKLMTFLLEVEPTQ